LTAGRSSTPSIPIRSRGCWRSRAAQIFPAYSSSSERTRHSTDILKRSAALGERTLVVEGNTEPRMTRFGSTLTVASCRRTNNPLNRSLPFDFFGMTFVPGTVPSTACDIRVRASLILRRHLLPAGGDRYPIFRVVPSIWYDHPLSSPEIDL